jgi:type IV pilus assembly protein PilM
LSLPERSVSTQVIDIPTLTDAELATSISWQAQQYIPIPKEDLLLNYQVLFRPEKKDAAVQNMRVLLAGVNRNDTDRLTAAYRQAGLEPAVMETESISVLRHLTADDANTAVMILNFGASGLGLTVVKNNELALAISHQTGSNMITKALMSTFNLPVEKAEEYKKAYGIDSRHAEGKIANAIVPVAQNILSDIKNTLTFYNNKNNLQAISRLYICGGGSLMPGFPELLAANLNLEVIQLNIFNELTGNVPQEDQLLYPVAAGLTKRK